MKTYRVPVLVVMCGVFLSVTGCAFGTRHVTLVYPLGKESKGLGPTVAEASTPLTRTGEPIILVAFADARSDKRVIGEVRNGLGMRTADVVAEHNVAEWVTQAMTMELEKAGYMVTKTDSASSPTTTPVLTGDIFTVYCSAFLSYEGEVSFMARLEKNGEEIFERPYFGKGTVGLNWAATSSSYGTSLSLALADAIGSLVVDLNTILLEK